MQDWKSILGEKKGDFPEGEVSPPNIEIETSNLSSSPCLNEKKFYITYERKGRGGKEVTLICCKDDSISNDRLTDFARFLKKKLGIGGGVEENAVILQGDKRKILAQKLPILIKEYNNQHK